MSTELEYVDKPENEFYNYIDEVESAILNNAEQLTCLPIRHIFTDGLYVREVTVPKGTVLTSKIHKVQHQFFVLKGSILVWDESGIGKQVFAPFIGVTEPNTRRMAYALEETVWATAHPNPLNLDLDSLEKEIFEQYRNPLLSDEMIKRLQESMEDSNTKSILLNHINQKQIS